MASTLTRFCCDKIGILLNKYITQVLRDQLGMADEEILELKREGVIG